MIAAYEMCWGSMICEIYGSLEVFLSSFYFIIGFLDMGKYQHLAVLRYGLLTQGSDLCCVS